MERDEFTAAREKRAAVKEADASGVIADSMDVRRALMARVHAGEITLEQAQKRLVTIKKNAAAQGKTTRSSVWAAG